MRRIFEILIAIVLFVIAAYSIKENLRYGREGVSVVGTVVKVTNRVEVDDRTLSYDKSPVVEFAPRGGAEKRRFRSSIWTSAWLTPKTGDSVRVLYLENEPENARIDSWAQWLLPVILLVMAVFTAMGWGTHRDSRWGFRWDD